VLRALVAALLLANAGYFAWTQGWLDGLTGRRADSQREPERLERQVRPETVLILSPTSALPPFAAPPAAGAATPAAASAALAGGGTCLEAGPFAAAEVDAAASAVQAALPPGSWADVKTDKPGSWLVYMGRYPDRELLAKKKEEIGRMKLPFEDVRSPPSLDPGLSLGKFDDRAGADKALAQLLLRGVKSARIVELTPTVSSHMLRVDAADEALVRQLGELKPAALLGKGFGPCAKLATN
jgi:hypothetical protein